MNRFRKVLFVLLCAAAILCAVSLTVFAVEPDDGHEHQWGEWIVTTEPDCINPGERVHYCDICGIDEKEPIDPTGIHSWGEWSVTTEPDCIHSGERIHYCTVCSADESETLDPTGIHTWGEPKNVQEPTYWAGGSYTHYCTVCNQPEEVTLDPLPNPFSDVKLNRWYSVPILYCYDHALMSGVGEGMFSLSAPVSRAMIVQIMAKLAGADLADPAYAVSNFNDVSTGRWYTAAIEWARSEGVAAGIGDGAFAPSRSITRQELAVFFYRLAVRVGIDVSGSYSAVLGSYEDAIELSGWATEAMSWAIGSGVMKGTTSSYISPKITLTRAQLAQFVYNFALLIPKE